MNRPNMLIPLMLMAASWAIAAWYWPHLPATMPVHWGLHGEPNGWMPMPWGALVGPLVTTFMAAVFALVSRRATSAEVGGVMAALGAAFGCFLTVLTLDTASRPDQHLDVRLLWGGMGLLFVVLGNYMPKLRRNPYMGIRTPWTMGNEEVWYRTHRVAGRIMVATGLVVTAASQLPPLPGTVVVIAALVAMGVGTSAYSYWLHRQLTNGGGPA
ncbi:MAG: hypothetical protein JWM80_2315 [Cyanobacteria bacterium RYN_339]|nr:hypothetical protein [Cyanobacteria bacterium RYN_339]